MNIEPKYKDKKAHNNVKNGGYKNSFMPRSAARDCSLGKNNIAPSKNWMLPKMVRICIGPQCYQISDLIPFIVKAKGGAK